MWIIVSQPKIHNQNAYFKFWKYSYFRQAEHWMKDFDLNQFFFYYMIDWNSFLRLELKAWCRCLLLLFIFTIQKTLHIMRCSQFFHDFLTSIIQLNLSYSVKIVPWDPSQFASKLMLNSRSFVIYLFFKAHYVCIFPCDWTDRVL